MSSQRLRQTSRGERITKEELRINSLQLDAMDATARRMAIIALLTGIVLPLGDLWMSLTSYSYAKLHLFIIAPVAFLYFVPPRPLSDAHPGVQRFAYTMMFVVAVVAVVYCVSGWDQILYQTGVYTCSNTFMTLLHIPIEEWVWCVDHTFLAGLWVMSIWHSRPISQTSCSSHVGFRAVAAVACLAVAYYGYMLKIQDKSQFYIGLTLQHIFPILAIQFVMSGHIYFQCPHECLLGILGPSVYVIIVDVYAVVKGIWMSADEFTTGIKVFGIKMEYIVVYTLTSSMASQAMVGFIRLSEIYQAMRKKTGSPFKAAALALTWG